MPATDSLRQKINELTAAPAAKKTRKKKAAAPAPRSDKDWTDAEKRGLAQAQAAGLGLYDIVVKIDPLCTMPIAARQLIQNAIREIGQVLVVRPDAKSAAASRQVEFILATLQTKERDCRQMPHPDNCRRDQRDSDPGRIAGQSLHKSCRAGGGSRGCNARPRLRIPHYRQLRPQPSLLSPRHQPHLRNRASRKH